jgi:hypothetical protein
VSEGRDEPDTVVEIELREQREVAFAELLLRSEEAEVDRAGAQVLGVLAKPLFVVRTDRAEVDRASVTELLVCRIVAEIAHRKACSLVRSRPIVDRKLPSAAEHPVERDHGDELAALRARDTELRGKELLLGLEDFEVARDSLSYR